MIRDINLGVLNSIFQLMSERAIGSEMDAAAGHRASVLRNSTSQPICILFTVDSGFPSHKKHGRRLRRRACRQLHGAHARRFREALRGNCMLVSLGDDRLSGNPWGGEWLASCPTMEVPQRVEWDREVVYECVYALLAAIDGYNKRINKVGGREIRSVLITPLATGYGRWSAERCAAQTVSARKHFAEVVEAGKG